MTKAKSQLYVWIRSIRWKAVKIVDVKQTKEQLLIRMRSITDSCRCPKCGCIANKYHVTYIRKVQDLPAFGKCPA